MAEYDVAKIQEKNTAKDRKNMSAQELAVLSNVYGIEKVSTFDQSQDSTQEDIRNVNDISTKSQKAGWNSALDFLSGLFIWRDKIDFTVNGTRFTGRDGYQVRGGAVPVFDGVVVDFLPATLKGDFTDKANMEAKGNNAQLVVYPRNMDMMFSVKLDDSVTIGIEDNTPFIIAESKENISITQNQENGKQVSIHADGVMLKKTADTDFQDTRLELIEPVVDNPEETREVEDVSITSAGVVIGYQEKPEEKSEEVQEQVQETEEEDKFSLTNTFDILSKGGDEEEEEDKEKEEEESALEKIKAFWGDDAKWTKIDFVKKALIEYFTTGKVPSPENSPFGNLSDIDKEGETNISLKFPILPGLNFTVGFEPGYEIKLSSTYFLKDAENSAITIKGLAEEIEKLFDEKKADKKNTGNTENKADNRELAQIIDKAEGLKLKLGGGLMVDGSLALKFTAGLQADASYLFQADANLYAEGKLQGRQDTGLAKAELSTTIGIENGKLAVGDKVDLNLDAGLSFNAGVGTEGKIVSRLFSWEKELWSKEFASVSIFEVNMNSQLSAPTGEGISGLKLVKSGIGFKTMSGKMKQNNWDNLKLRMNDPSPIVNMLTKGADAQIKDMDSLIQEYEELKKNTLYMDKSRSLSKQEGEDSFHNMKDHFIVFTQSLESKLRQTDVILRNIQGAVDNILQGKAYQSNMKKTEENIEKHKERLRQMEEWSNSLKNGENGENDVTGLRDSQAFAKYQEITGSNGAGMVSASKKNISERAKMNVATREKLLKYEERRQQEVLKDKDKLLDELNAELEASGIDKTTANPQFLKFYLNKEKHSGLLNQISLYYRNKQSVIDYEIARYRAVTNKHLDRKKILEAKIKAEGINSTAPNKEFVQFYEKELGAKQMLTDLINSKKTTVDSLISYEVAKVTEKTKSKNYYERIQELEEYKKKWNSTPSIKTRNEIEAEAREHFFTYEDSDVVKKQSYKMASAKDLKDYEENWMAATKSKQEKSQHAADNYHTLQKMIVEDTRSGRIEQDDGNRGKLLHSMSKAGRANLDQMIKDGKIDMKPVKKASNTALTDTIKDNVSLETLVEFQRKRLEEGKEAPNAEAKITYLKTCINNIRKLEKESARQELIERVREQYFSGELWQSLYSESDKSIRDEHKELVKKISKQEINDAFVLHDLWMKEYDQYYGIHEERAKKISQLQQDRLNDMQIWDAYKAMGAGKRFKTEWLNAHRNKELDDITIEQMILYEKRQLRKETRQNWLKQQMMKLKAGDNADFLIKGGHYQRVLSLMEWRDEEFKEGETEEQHTKEVLRRYQEELYAGGGYEDYLEEHRYELVRPIDIVTYEGDRALQKGEKHMKRIKDLQLSEGKELSKFDMEYYRETAMADGDGIKDKINNVVSQVYSGYSTGYDKSLDAEKVLTPQMILDYENDQKEELSRKHGDRISLLLNEGVRDDEIWEKYREYGGGKRFARVNKAEISQESEEVAQNFYNYDNITDYEKGRLEHYNTIKNSINEPVKNMQIKATELQKKMEELQVIQDELNKVTPETFFLGDNALDKPVSDLQQKSADSQDIMNVDDMDEYATVIEGKAKELDNYLNDEDVEELFEL